MNDDLLIDVDRLAADIRGLNPDYYDFEAEVAKMIRAALAPSSTWQGAALRLGEELATSGPNGYYGFTPDQWLAWAQSVVRETSLRGADLRKELCAYLDKLDIRSENIGAVRGSLFTPWDSSWNAWVRDETAKRERRSDRA
jgi:hypothetical protein